MLLFKFNLVFTAIFFSLNAMSFSDMECFNGNLDVEVNHKAMPFGLTKTKISITKNDCEIIVRHEKLKFLKEYWLIDICREPIHIKKGDTAVEVIKKEGSCLNSQKEDFCKETTSILKKIQDDGLIFAAGEKENLSTDHGKVFCVYQLLKAHLNRDVVFNRGQNYDGVLSGKKIAPSAPTVLSPGTETTPAPAANQGRGTF